MLRSLFSMIMLVLASATSLYAGDLSLGVSVLGKAGINATKPPEYIKTDVSFNTAPDLALSALYLFSKTTNVGVVLDIGYDNHSYRMNYFDSDEKIFGSIYGDKGTSQTVSSISIAPSIYLGGFQLGVAVGFPSTYTVRNNRGEVVRTVDGVLPSLTTEVRIGAMIPVFRNKTSLVNLNVRAGYMLTETFTSTQPSLDFIVTDRSPLHNSKIASLGLGVSYYFTVMD